MNEQQICFAAMEIVKKAGEFVRQNRRIFADDEINKKADRDFVTEIDKASERILVEGLQHILPEAGFLTEEKTVEQSESALLWVIDPIDGTTNFIHNTPVTAVSVALMNGSEHLVGIVYEVSMDEMFYTWKDAGASYCNGRRIQVRSNTSFKRALVGTGFPYQRQQRIPGILQSMGYFLEHCQDIRRFGSAATDLCYVACGRLDIYYEAYLQIWDIAAGIQIVQNAGGEVYNMDGSLPLTYNNVVATHASLMKETLIGLFKPVYLTNDGVDQ